VVAAYLPELFPDRVLHDEAVLDALAQTFYSVHFWAVVALANAVLLVCIGLLIWELKRLRALPDINSTDGGGS